MNFVTKQFIIRTELNPSLEKLTLKIEGDMPERQKNIIDALVKIYNRSPELYEDLRNPKNLKNLAKYFGRQK